MSSKVVSLYSVPSPTNTILNIETIPDEEFVPGKTQASVTECSGQEYSLQSVHSGVAKTKHIHHRRITRSVVDWQVLIDWINKAFGELIPPPPPPSSCADLTVVGASVTTILSWISSQEKVMTSNGWSSFLQADFIFQAPMLPPSRPRSLTSLFFSKQAMAKEVDVKFDEAKESALDWQQLLSSFGRINEKIGLAERESAKSCKETAVRLLALQDFIPQNIHRKSTKFFESDSVFLARQASYRLSTLNDQLVMALKGTQIVLNSLDNRRQILTDYEDACQNTQKKLITMESLRSSRTIKQELVDAALEDMTNVKKVEVESKQKFKDATDTLRLELAAYEARRDAFLESVLDAYAKRQIEGLGALYSLL